MAHRLMTVEAIARFGWPHQGIVSRLRRRPARVQQLALYRQAIDDLTLYKVQTLPVDRPLVSLAADVSRQFGLLCGDALIVTAMRRHGLIHLASHDADFDRVPGLTRYCPV
jgi:predicted nucleic acid-binding protein